MQLAYIPWFKLHEWRIPVPFFGDLPIQPFGVLVAIGIIFGSSVAQRRADKVGVPRQLVDQFLMNVITLGLLLCMLFNVVVYEPDKVIQMGYAVVSWFSKGPNVSFPYPGMSSFGGFIGGTLVALWFRHKHRVSLMHLGDIFCYTFPFAWVICRSGCFVVHDHPGLVTNFFLAVDNYNNRGLPRHDLGLYEVLWSAVMIPIVSYLGSKPRPTGFFLAFVPLAYAPVRFGFDFLRESDANGGDVRYGGLTPGHYAAMALLVVGLLVARRVARGPAPQLWLDGTPPEATAAALSAPADASSAGSTKASTSKAKKKKKKKSR